MNTIKKIAIQGVRGAFHEIAARNYYHEPIDVVPAITFNDLITESKRNDGGMMAIENSIAGTLIQNFPLIRNSTLDITGEVYLRIKHNLMALPGQRLEDIERVYSHPMAIAQCLDFFKDYPHIHLVAAEDTALSAKKIRESKEKRVGAIASQKAADLYEMEILSTSIETNKQNYTRFLSIKNKDEKLDVSNCKKVSLCFSLTHEIGSLHKILKLLADYGANLTKIQSFPIVGNRWNYMFFIDLVLKDSTQYEPVLKALKSKTVDLRVLGRYNTGIHYED